MTIWSGSGQAARATGVIAAKERLRSAAADIAIDGAAHRGMEVTRDKLRRFENDRPIKCYSAGKEDRISHRTRRGGVMDP